MIYFHCILFLKDVKICVFPSHCVIDVKSSWNNSIIHVHFKIIPIYEHNSYLNLGDQSINSQNNVPYIGIPPKFSNNGRKSQVTVCCV